MSTCRELPAAGHSIISGRSSPKPGSTSPDRKPPINIDEKVIRHFQNHPDDWWSPKSPLKALHGINPLRTGYIRQRAALQGKQILDVGCGGGILSESLAAAGGRVTGIDMAASALDAARSHMEETGLRIEYRLITAEALARESPGRFDIITCMELLEHVPEPASTLSACAALVKPGGDLFLSTINRTWTAWLLVILAAERVFGIVQKGTHQYRYFIPPPDLVRWAETTGFAVKDISGWFYMPVLNRARIRRSTRVNYMMHLKRTD